MAKCTHEHTTSGEHYGFMGPVSRDENRAAHGSITYTETCVSCGAERNVNQNQNHYEHGPWGPDRAERDREERARHARGLHVESVDHARGLAAVYIPADRGLKWIPLAELRAAAAQPDNGDGLVTEYSRLCAEVDRLSRRRHA